MRCILITPNFRPVSLTFIMRHIEQLRRRQALCGVIVTSNVPDEAWQDIPVISLGRFTLRPFLDRAWRSLFRSLGIDRNLSPRYPADETLQALLASKRIEFDSVLVEYADTAYNLHKSIVSWLRNGKHVVIHLHGYDTVDTSFPTDYVPRLRQIAELGAVFVANSHFTASSLSSWQIPDGRLVVKHLGVEVPKTTHNHHSDSAITILHLGRLVDFKAPHLTMKAFELACERGLKGNLIIAGEGELRKQCEILRENSPWKERIALLGAVDWSQAETLRRSADVFTLHSIVGETSGRIENLGVAVLEAMASGLPVVTCAMGGIKETVVDGETGIFFPPGDIDAQADAFLKLANNPEFRKELGMRGRDRVKANFSVEREEDAFLSLFG